MKGGDGVFPPTVVLMVERVRQEHRRPGLFIGWLGRCPNGEIFLAAMLIHHSAMWLTLSGHIAMAGAWSCARRSCLGGSSYGSARRRPGTDH